MDYGPAEMMCVALAREIGEGDVVFHGLSSPVPMTAVKLAKALGKDFTLVSISDGVDPDWSRPAVIGSTISANTYEGAVAAYGLDEVFDLAATGRVDIVLLSYLQLDVRGRINMSFVGGDYDHPKFRGPGGAGSATLIPVTPRTIIWRTKHEARSLVEQVDFATTAANPDNDFTVVTNLCVFRMKNGLLEVDSVFPYSGLDEVKENTGWRIDQAEVPVYAAPAADELAALERVDPHRIRYIEF
jgi:glutaconate CoA-transferase, subunit B